MKCTQCSQENQSDAVFCKACGQALTRENVEESAAVSDEVANEASNTAAENANAVTVQSNKAKFSGKLAILIGSSILVFALIIVVVVALTSASLNSNNETSSLVNFITNGFSAGTTDNNYVTISYLYNDDTERTTVLVNEAITDITFSDSVFQVHSNLAGDVNAVLTSDHALYHVTAKKAERIAYDIEYFAVANKGNIVVFTDSDSTLYLYNGEKNLKTKIADDVEHGNFAISPDGKIVSYTSDDDLYLYARSEAKYIAGSMESISVTNGGMIYALKGNALYSCTIKEGASKVASDIRAIRMTNNDASEILFASDNKMYISINGGEKIKVGNYDYLRPSVSNVLYRNNYATGVEYGIDSLLNILYLSPEGDLLYFNNKFETTKISSKVKGYPKLTSNNSVFYLNETNRLYSVVINNKGGGATPELLAKDVESWAVTSDGATIYYIDNEHVLWCRSGLSEPVHIEDSVYKLSMTQKDVLLYIAASDSELTMGYVKNKGQDKAVIDSNVTSLRMTPNTVYYEKVGDNDGQDIYISDGTEKFARIGVDVQQSLKADQYSVEIFANDIDEIRQSTQRLTYADFDFYVDGVKVTDWIGELDNKVEFIYRLWENESVYELRSIFDKIRESTDSDIVTNRGIGIDASLESFLDKYGHFECYKWIPDRGSSEKRWFSSISEYFEQSDFNRQIDLVFLGYNGRIYGVQEFLKGVESEEFDKAEENIPKDDTYYRLIMQIHISDDGKFIDGITFYGYKYSTSDIDYIYESVASWMGVSEIMGARSEPLSYNDFEQKPSLTSPKLVQMEGFTLYLSQPRNQIERILEPGAGGEYGDGSTFVDYPEKMIIVDYDVEGNAIQIRLNTEGMLYNGIQVGMTRDEVKAMVPDWTISSDGDRLRTNYSKDDKKAIGNDIAYYIEYRFDKDDKIDRIYISYVN